MSKVTTHQGVNPQEKFDELRKLANTEITSTSCLALATYRDLACGHQQVAGWNSSRLSQRNR